MNAVTITDLTNAKLDTDTIAAFASSTALAVTDRLGNTKSTLAGMNAVEATARATRDSAEAAAKLLRGYEPPVAYTSGINLTRATQTVMTGGLAYAPDAAQLPFTTSGTFETAKFRLIQGVTAADLMTNTQGSASAAIVQPTEYTNEQPTTVFAILRGRANVKRFWVAGDGADWKNAFQKASASGARNITVPGDLLYSVSDQVNILDDQDWYLDNAQITLTDQTKVLFSAVQKSRWGMRGRGFLKGSLTSPSTAVETGLKIDGGKRYVVEGLTASSFKGKGLHLTGTVNATALRGDRGHFSNIGAHENTGGIVIDAGAASEYNTWTNTNASGNVVGMDMAAGNNTVTGGSIVDNGRGVVLTAGSNHCHGIFTGVNINHNTVYNLEAVDVTFGHTFTGCHFYGSGSSTGAIFLNNSKGIRLNGGDLDCWVYNYSGSSSGYNYITDMHCPGSYGDVIRIDSSSLIPQELIIQGCTGPGAYQSGLSINDPAPVYLNAVRAAAATQALGGSTALVFPTIAANGDRRRAYNTTTGAFTAPANQAGQYRIGANLFFTGTGVSAAGSYVEVVVNNATPRLYLLSQYGTTLLTTTINEDRYLNAGDVVNIKADISATLPLFGGASWQSALQIQRIE
jgi:hypothetical protein